MTKEGTSLLTSSQEDQLFREFANGEIQIDPLQFSASFDNLEHTFESQPLAHCEYVAPVVDDKLQLQQAIAMNQLPFNTTPILGKEEFAGIFNFQLILNHHNGGKHWVYSEKLSKVFIHMEEVLPLQFQWTPPTEGLWVRATMVYKLDQHRSQPVVRCHNHMAPDNISNRSMDSRQLKHVVRCLHSVSTYEETQSGHLSVLTPLGTPEAGIHYVPMDFKFFCKNSCTTGMNRRPTELIFTLETDQNQIVGRRKLEIRVCSCPKRDKEKEELELDNNYRRNTPSTGKKRKSAPLGLPPPGKKFKNDGNVFDLNLKILGKDNYNAVVKYAHDVMAGAAIKTGNHDQYKPYMDEVNQKYL